MFKIQITRNKTSYKIVESISGATILEFMRHGIFNKWFDITIIH